MLLQIDRFKDIIYDVLIYNDHFSNASSSSINYVNHLLKDVGFAGGRFFMLSYNFLGSVIYAPNLHFNK